MATMNKPAQKRALEVAVKAAWTVGSLMRHNLRSSKTIQKATQHDLKIELDGRSQSLIQERLLRAFPASAVLGEEGTSGDASAPLRWVVDPIDGTVNFAYGIPHACVSVALQERVRGNDDQLPAAPVIAAPAPSTPDAPAAEPEFRTVIGVVYDPFCDELWTAIEGEQARLNGRTVHVSQRQKLQETIVSLGFGKSREVLDRLLPMFNMLVHRVRKIRIMGSAALALTYVATGRFDAYVEAGPRLWDFAAGALIVECAGGEFWRQQLPGREAYELVASNGLLRSQLQRRTSPCSHE